MIRIERNDLEGNVLLLICEQDSTAKLQELSNLLLNPQCDRVERFVTEEGAKLYTTTNNLTIKEEDED